MPDARSRSSGCSTVTSARDALVSVRDSENLLAAYLGSPIGGGFRAELDRARGLRESQRLKRAARLAVAASIILAGTGPEAKS
jgi:hypothetical protein